MVTFTHTADCHIGAQREPALRELASLAFATFITRTIEERADFTLIAGDLFNTAVPGIDALKETVTQLDRLRKAGIRVYAIPGSHDYSPTGKTMLDVLERAGLLVQVWKPVEHEGKLTLHWALDATGVRIAGIPGRQGMLDHSWYDQLAPVDVQGPRILMVHTAISPYAALPGAQAADAIPPGCTYYAAGHVHIPGIHTHAGAPFVYPGPLFPNSFSELETLGHGSFAIIRNWQPRIEPVPLAPIVRISVDGTGRAAPAVRDALTTQLHAQEVRDALVLIRVSGMIDGATRDLGLREIAQEALQRGARCVLRNTAGITSPQQQTQAPHTTIQDLEERMLATHARALALPTHDGIALARALLRTLAREPADGERQAQYQDAVLHDAIDELTRTIAR